MSDMNVIKGGRNCSGGMGGEVIIFISDIHTSHMVPTPAAVLGVVLPYQVAIMSAADARRGSSQC